MKNRPAFSCLVLLLAVSWCSAATSPASAANPHQQLQRILQDPMYQSWHLRQEGHLPSFNSETMSFRDMVKYLARKLGNFLDWLFNSKSNSSNSSSGSSTSLLPSFLTAMAWIAVALAIIFIVILIVKMLNNPHRKIESAHILSRQQIQRALESGDALALGAADWLNEAQRLAAEQNFRAVYRALYLALLSGLHSAGKIEHNKNRTNWMYVQHYRGPAQERATFGELTDLFDRVWYGHKDAGARNIDQLRLTISTLTQSGGHP